MTDTIVDLATGNAEDPDPNQYAVAAAAMKTDLPGCITPELLSRAREEQARLEQDILELQRKLELVAQFVHLAARYLNDSELEQDKQEAATIVGPTSMVGLVRRIANESARPMTKEEMKNRLTAAGVPDKRTHGNYFYMTLYRLRRKEEIRILADGRIWGAKSWQT